MIFSPIVATAVEIWSTIFTPSAFVSSNAASTDAGLAASNCSAKEATNTWNLSFFATKSVSAFTSRMIASLPCSKI